MRKLATRIEQLSGEGALSVFSRARELEAEGRSIIHLELGEPDFHPAPPVVGAAKAALDAGRDRYTPIAGIPELQQAIAQYLRSTRDLGVEPDRVMISPGCKMALSLVMTALIEPGDEVLYPQAGFPIYPSLTRALGGRAVPFSLAEENRFQPDPRQIDYSITSSTKLLILNSPNNPTGTVYSPDVLHELARLARAHDLWVISDEIYARIVYDQEFTSIAGLRGMAERTIIVDGFSKAFAMTGWRLGYAVVPRSLLEALRLLVTNTFTCASEFIQRAAVEALRDTDHAVDRMLGEFKARREMFIAGLDRVPGFRCAKPDGAFYAWVNVQQTGLAAGELCRLLLDEAGVAGIPGTAFGASCDGYLRFSFAASQAQLQAALQRILAVAPRWQRTAAAVRS